MAKRRKKTTRRRRSRMGGVGKDTMNAVIGVAIGAVGARMIQKMIPGNGKIISGVQIVAGGYLASKARSGIMRGAGYGCMGTGVTDLLQQVKVIGAIDEDGYTAVVPMAGFIEDPISGFDDDMGLNGVMDGWDGMQGVDFVEDPINGPGDDNMSDDLSESVVGYNY